MLSVVMLGVLVQSKVISSEVNLYRFPRRHDTQQNGTQQNDIQHNEIQYNDNQRNGTQHNDIQHNSKSIETLSIM